MTLLVSRVVKVIRSCETIEQNLVCREWVLKISMKQMIDPTYWLYFQEEISSNYNKVLNK